MDVQALTDELRYHTTYVKVNGVSSSYDEIFDNGGKPLDFVKKIVDTKKFRNDVEKNLENDTEQLTYHKAFDKLDNEVQKAFDLGYSVEDINDLLGNLVDNSLHFAADNGLNPNPYCVDENGLLPPTDPIFGEPCSVTASTAKRIASEMKVLSKILINDLSSIRICKTGFDAVKPELGTYDAERVDYGKFWDTFNKNMGVNVEPNQERCDAFTEWCKDNIEMIRDTTPGFNSPDMMSEEREKYLYSILEAGQAVRDTLKDIIDAGVSPTDAYEAL